MATHEFSIINSNVHFDDGVFPSPLSTQLAMANGPDPMIIVLPYPTTADVGLKGAFQIPQNYAGTPQMVARMVIDGTPANTLGLTAQQIAVADTETVDVAFETEDTASNATWTGYANEELIEMIITLTPGSAYQVDDTVLFYFARDNSVDTQTINVLLLDLLFRYSDT